MNKRFFLLVPALFAAAFALGLAVAPASAAPDLEVAAIDAALTGEAELSGALVGVGDEIDHRGRRGKRGHSACARLAHAVKKACPCEGNDEDGWESHEEYVDCVSAKLDEIVDDENERQVECATKIIERAEASEIGNEGYECPTRKGRCGKKGERPAPPGDDPGF